MKIDSVPSASHGLSSRSGSCPVAKAFLV